MEHITSRRLLVICNAFDSLCFAYYVTLKCWIPFFLLSFFIQCVFVFADMMASVRFLTVTTQRERADMNTDKEAHFQIAWLVRRLSGP